MKPTQQEIIELARDAGIPLGSTVVGYTKTEPCVTKELERLVHLVLERFGAGGGEPVAWMSPGKERLEFSRSDTVYGSHTIPLYTHPSPTDLQSVRDRALDDAAAICRTYDCSPRMAAAEIEALKGKQ